MLSFKSGFPESCAEHGEAELSSQWNKTAVKGKGKVKEFGLIPYGVNTYSHSESLISLGFSPYSHTKQPVVFL